MRPTIDDIHALDPEAAERERSVEAAVRHRWGPLEVPCAPDEFVIAVGCRDAEPWLDSFFRHHDRFNPKHYFFLDNGSTDSTLQRLRSRRDVTLLECHLPFDRHSQDFGRYLLKRFGAGKWLLLIDQDHLFDYPGSQHLPLPALLGYLNHHRFDAVRTQVVDMFSDRDLDQPSTNADLESSFPYCDLSDIWAVPDPYGEHNHGHAREIPFLTGGIRKTAFGTDWLYLTFHALLFDGYRLLHPDAMCVLGATVADLAATARHYKFAGNLASSARRQIESWTTPLVNRTYEANRREVSAYLTTLTKNPKLNLMSPNALRLQSTDQLVHAGILSISERYRSWVARSAMVQARILEGTT